MVEFESNIDSANRVYLKEEIRKVLGKEVKMIPNAFAVVIYGKDTNLENVRKSIELILHDIDLRLANTNTKKENQENAQTKDS